MSTFRKFLILFTVVALILSVALVVDTGDAEASFKEHKCNGRSCEPHNGGNAQSCSRSAGRNSPHC